MKTTNRELFTMYVDYAKDAQIDRAELRSMDKAFQAINGKPVDEIRNEAGRLLAVVKTIGYVIDKREEPHAKPITHIMNAKGTHSLATMYDMDGCLEWTMHEIVYGTFEEFASMSRMYEAISESETRAENAWLHHAEGAGERLDPMGYEHDRTLQNYDPQTSCH